MVAVPHTNVDPTTIQSLHGNLEALALCSQTAGYRHTTVLEKDLPCWL